MSTCRAQVPNYKAQTNFNQDFSLLPFYSFNGATGQN